MANEEINWVVIYVKLLLHNMSSSIAYFISRINSFFEKLRLNYSKIMIFTVRLHIDLANGIIFYNLSGFLLLFWVSISS